MKFEHDLRWTLFPDMHAQYDRFARAIEYHDAHTDIFGILGDFIDGPETRKTVKLIRSLGVRAVAITGNHEWVLRNSLSTIDLGAAAIWAHDVWPKYEKNVLVSYGVAEGSAHMGGVARAHKLRTRLQENGDYEWLESLPAYIETPTFIGVHSGPLLDLPWPEQANQLEEDRSPEARLSVEPEQIFSRDLAGIQPTSPDIDSRIFVTGHRHFNLPKEQRRAFGRICLASPLNRGAPLFTWTSEDDQIHEHAA